MIRDGIFQGGPQRMFVFTFAPLHVVPPSPCILGPACLMVPSLLSQPLPSQAIPLASSVPFPFLCRSWHACPPCSE